MFIDEAGQIAVADLVAVSTSTKNLILLGDQMQLGQPTKGSHPGDSGLSCLDYLFKGQSTVSPNMGIFLGDSYRMHPKVCTLISEGIYEGRLQSKPETKNRTIKASKNDSMVTLEAGVQFIEVAHQNNTQSSDEEVAVIQQLVSELCGRTYTDKDGKDAGVIGLEHMLFVAPYNMQVRKLQNALGEKAKVGSRG